MTKSDVDIVVSNLSTERITTEPGLYYFLTRDLDWSEERARKAVNDALIQNKIRWVAHQGWLKGGRPQ